MDTSWMFADRRTEEYKSGVTFFLKIAIENASNPSHISCPCSKCLNMKSFSASVVKKHLFFNGIDKAYTDWIWHGQPPRSAASQCPNIDYGVHSESVDMEGVDLDDLEVQSNDFLKVIDDGDKSLYPGCTTRTKLGTLVKLYNLKAKHGMTNACFNDLLVELSTMLPEDNEIPSSMYEAKKIMRALGLQYEKIHACPNDCILYRKEYEHAVQCPTKFSTRKVVWKSLVGIPLQPDGKQCGYYVMRYMKDIINDKELNFASKWEKMSNLTYTQSDIDEVREEWAKFVTPYFAE